jgi:hypothetical protein
MPKKTGLDKALDEILADLQNFLAIRNNSGESLWIQLSTCFFYVIYPVFWKRQKSLVTGIWNWYSSDLMERGLVC